MNILAKAKVNHRLTAGRVAALALLFCFVAAIILSHVVIVTHTGHDHNYNDADGGCSVCSLLSDTQRRLGHSDTLVRISAPLTAAFTASLFLFAFFISDRISSLVHLKIQFNN